MSSIGVGTINQVEIPCYMLEILREEIEILLNAIKYLKNRNKNLRMWAHIDKIIPIPNTLKVFVPLEGDDRYYDLVRRKTITFIREKQFWENCVGPFLVPSSDFLKPIIERVLKIKNGGNERLEYRFDRESTYENPSIHLSFVSDKLAREICLTIIGKIQEVEDIFIP